MQVKNEPDFPTEDASCKAATGKTLGEWYSQLDADDALKLGRRDTIKKIYEGTKDAWWATTIAVEYEKSKGLRKKDGLFEGYTICVTKSINAPVSKTYQAWDDGFSDMFGDAGSQDLIEGGKITGGGCEGEFTRIRPEKDLRFTWRHPGITAPVQIDVQFQDNKGKTLMNVMPSRVQTRGEADGLRNAWSEAMNRLKALAEA